MVGCFVPSDLTVEGVLEAKCPAGYRMKSSGVAGVSARRMQAKQRSVRSGDGETRAGPPHAELFNRAWLS